MSLRNVCIPLTIIILTLTVHGDGAGMKSTLPPSKNVEDRSRDTSVFAPHSNPRGNAIINRSRLIEEVVSRLTNSGNAQRAAGTSFEPMLAGMDKSYAQRKKQKRDPDARIPIPTERPDPTVPYKRPTVFTNGWRTPRSLVSQDIQPMAYVGTPKYFGSDLETLASILQGEAGGEGLLGMQAVADVIRNRAAKNFSGYGSGLVDQALARNQFQGQSAKISPEARAVAQQLQSGNLPDVAGNALYYANPGASTAAWARRLNSSNAQKIGNHYFTDNANGTPFSAPSPYAALPDGPKGQEMYAPPETPGLAQPQGILSGVPSDVASYAASGEKKSPLQNFFSALAQTPDAPPVRFQQMGDARQTGDALLKQLQATPISQILLKQRLLG